MAGTPIIPCHYQASKFYWAREYFSESGVYLEKKRRRPDQNYGRVFHSRPKNPTFNVFIFSFVRPIMNRRNFLKESSRLTLPLFALTYAACDPRHRNESAQTLENGHWTDEFLLNEVTIGELQEKMRTGALTSKAIAELYLKRIDAVDKHGPLLKAVIELNPDALAIAGRLDRERKSNFIRGPLHGIPVLIKDNIDTADNMMTTAGSLAMVGNKAAHDAFIVQRLREAGAVILGKTNLSEWANFRSSRSTSGWSSRGGQTRNPYALDRNPCGSSSGSGVAVASNLCAVAIGTETNGSIACPSSINGIVGIKPTVGLWSRSGIIPISQTQDTAGPMARTVTDAAILLGALTGNDPADPATSRRDDKRVTDYSSFLKPGLSGKRIGVEKSFLKNHEAVDALLNRALAQLKDAGATIVEVDLLKKLKPLNGEEFKVLKYEFKDGLNRYLASAHAPVKSLKEIIDFNRRNEARAMPFFKQETLEKAESVGGLDSQEYIEARNTLLRITRDAIDSTLKENNLDAVCGPANGPSWCTDLINGDAFTGYGMYSSAAMAGYPSVTVPMGNVVGLPIGLSFLGTAYQEGQLLQIAYAYEQVSKNRKRPTFENAIPGGA
jgi:amidase